MPYQLPPDIQQRIKSYLEVGSGDSEDHVLRLALDALDWQEEEVRAIGQGIDDMEAGRVRPLREFDKEFRTQKKSHRMRDARSHSDEAGGRIPAVIGLFPLRS